ncbi:hypothetical protein FZEAL_771 [Fusarium zealandicum]|uniref:Uncharacterized protein n=1 Tax=Fusarium zealandicum TaxID=1053134 RepID=A0A8H4UUV0_9HYPO|nr:hypothetical protein FZEAL_771 [Fusarium zealandicum]
MDEDKIKQVDIPPWCGLCRLEFIVGEDVQVVYRDGMFGEERYKAGQTYLEQETRAPSRFHFQYIQNWSGTALETEPLACHSECVGRIKHRLFHCMAWSACDFIPPRLEQTRRLDWLKWEYQRNVASRPSPYAPLPSQPCLASLVLTNSESVFTLTTPIVFRQLLKLDEQTWVRLVNLEGVFYIAEMSSKSFSPSISTRLKRPLGKEIDSLYVASDHLGVRAIVLANSAEVPDILPYPGIWWSTHALMPGRHLWTESDGIKLRIVRGDLFPLTHAESNWFWAIPKPLITNIRSLPINPLLDSLDDGSKRRFGLFQCNYPNVTGYSVCLFEGLQAVHVHAHLRGDDLAFYNNDAPVSPRPVLWIYMPIDRDDRVVEVWACQHDVQGTLVMKTSKGRLWTLGPRLTGEERFVK